MRSKAHLERGEVYWTDFGPPVDNRQSGRRPGVIIQTDALNRASRYKLTIVLPITTHGARDPSFIEIKPSTLNGLREESWTIGNQPTTIMKDQVYSYIGRLTEEDLERALSGMDLAMGRH